MINYQNLYGLTSRKPQCQDFTLALQNQSKREEERRAHEEMGHTIVSPRRVVNGMRTWEERVVIKTHPKYLNTHSTKIDFEQNLIIF